ncbi:outer membrane beta-barrel protein [Pontibacter chinhatensis]|uniref:Outer membrane protein beta-barrel domain-containing protein n=1 Tax=Pontibacter chinhatensis TaxID=1436961 RepID=A0A1I2WHG3_9BACT|nr:outer membrane beta-barrel protein [Pontibacter chinhatensis]SFH00107.1 Outer membrane protein beta-barrel domain-containing protein [Pontibacter chinhatensis]
MKKIFTAFVFILTCSFTSRVLAQDNAELTIGAKAGINFYSLSSDALVEDDDTGLSYEFGIYGRIGDRFFVQPELNLVSHKTHLITRTQARVGERDALNVHYLRVPVLFGYRTDYNGAVASQIRFMVGPSISYAVGVADNRIDVKRNDLRNAQFALNGGVGFELWVFHLDLMYHHYLSTLFKDGRSEGKGRAFSLTAGLGF